MDAIFLKILNMSITAGWFVLAVIALRLILKKAPKAITVVLWALVGLRLILPFSFESNLSLLPSKEFVPEETVYSHSSVALEGNEILDYIGNNPVSYDLTVKDGSLTFSEFSAPDTGYVNPLQIAAYVASILWITGMVAMGLYAIVSCIRIWKNVREATFVQDNIWICDRIQSPFIFGIIRPRIYLPSNIDEKDVTFVIEHEKAHLKRLDHWWKPLGFLLLTVYWFNPLVWVAYILLCRDIESACDEKVLKKMGMGIKKSYSEALLNCSVPRKLITACPLAFGEEGVKGRIKSVLHYKKPTLWIVLVAVTACIAAGIFFLTDPKPPKGTTPEERFGFTVTSSFPDVSIELLDFERDEKEATITYSVKNETDESITLGNAFRLLRFQDGEWKDWKHNGDYYFHSILPLLNPGESMERSVHWFAADTSMVGKYRIEFGYMLYDNWDGKRNQLVERDHIGRFEFEVTEDWGIPNYTHSYTQYDPDLIPSSQQNAELRLNYVNKRFALVHYGKVLEEGVYSTEKYLGMLTLITDQGKQYVLVPTLDNHVIFLQTHSDPIPKELLEDNSSSLTLIDWDFSNLLPVSYADCTIRYRIASDEKWTPELWLTDVVHLNGKFYIWKEPIIDGGYATRIDGFYKVVGNQIVCTADDGNVYEFKWFDIYNDKNWENHGYWPQKHPIYVKGTSHLPFPIGEELKISN